MSCPNCPDPDVARKVDELHNAIIGTTDKPGLCEKVRVVNARTKRHSSYFGGLAALIGGWAIKFFLHQGP